jgi:predicted negative regulator of RcsB-dependent stress response
MTTPIIDPNDPVSQPKAESFVDWFHINSRAITIGAAVVVVAGFGAWFVQREKLNETINSDRQLMQAKQSLNSQNQALAESDLKKVVDKYGDRPAGLEAGLLLAQLKFEKGDFAGAAASLKDLSGKVGNGPSAAQVNGLLGDALSQQSKPAEAAAEYEKAAGATTMANEKNFWLSKAAAAYMTAQKIPEAKKLYEGLAAQSDNQALSTEAHLRLGELTLGTKM